MATIIDFESRSQRSPSPIAGTIAEYFDVVIEVFRQTGRGTKE
jgi:hypothetical protein